MKKLLIYKIIHSNLATKPLQISHCLTIKEDFTWSLVVFYVAVDGTSCPLLSNILETMDASSLNMLLELIDKLNICPGHPDLHFVKMVSAKKRQNTVT